MEDLIPPTPSEPLHHAWLLRLHHYKPARAVLYIGVTNNLPQRLAQHFQNRGTPETFAGKYFCYNLIYVEQYADITAAIAREKELKGWTRARKNALIATVNLEWDFLVL